MQSAKRNKHQHCCFLLCPPVSESSFALCSFTSLIQYPKLSNITWTWTFTSYKHDAILLLCPHVILRHYWTSDYDQTFCGMNLNILSLQCVQSLPMMHSCPYAITTKVNSGQMILKYLSCCMTCCLQPFFFKGNHDVCSLTAPPDTSDTFLFLYFVLQRYWLLISNVNWYFINFNQSNPFWKQVHFIFWQRGQSKDVSGPYFTHLLIFTQVSCKGKQL